MITSLNVDDCVKTFLTSSFFVMNVVLPFEGMFLILTHGGEHVCALLSVMNQSVSLLWCCVLRCVGLDWTGLTNYTSLMVGDRMYCESRCCCLTLVVFWWTSWFVRTRLFRLMAVETYSLSVWDSGAGSTPEKGHRVNDVAGRCGRI